MAGELQASVGTTGLTLYAVLRNANALCYYITGSTFEAYNASHYSAYAITLTEQGSTGYYAGTMPTVALGLYNIDVRQQVGGSPAISDTFIGATAILWSGSAEDNSYGSGGGGGGSFSDTQLLTIPPVPGSIGAAIIRAATKTS